MIELLKNFVMPSQLGSLLVLIGIGLSMAKSYRRAALSLVLVGSTALMVFSSGVIASLLMSPLEYRFPPISSTNSHANVETVVVLTAFSTNDPNMPLSSRVGSSAAYRILEAARLASDGSIETVIVSGNLAATLVMRDLLISIGLPQELVQLEGNSNHTVDSARNVSAIISGRPFFLVTSAGHMPRALGVFRKQGLNPIPAPTDFQLPKSPGSALIFPSPFHLGVSDLAIREYIGLLWYRVTGKTDQYW